LDPEIDIVWCARGGYGATRLLPMLDQMAKGRGKPAKKLLIGYSDVTVLHEYVRREWGWSTLHAVMPAATKFRTLKEWENILKLVRGEKVEYPASETAVKFLANAPKATIRAELVGGNFCLWECLVGTKHPPASGRGRILFFEDIGEPFYRLDRMMTRLAQSGVLDGAAAIILGDFTDCNDEKNQCLKPVQGEARAKALADPTNAEKVPLRKVYEQAEAFEYIFGDVCRKIGIPLGMGLPVGHGPNFYPLPLGANYELSVDGRLRLLEWDWISETRAGV
jgi:muramoyltetrapeptide carboxypeptidase LdcA involved in peptidoglycan recycling